MSFLTIKQYQKRSKLSRPTIMKRINAGLIKSGLGRNDRGVPCIVIDGDKYPPSKQGRDKPGRKKR